MQKDVKPQRTVGIYEQPERPLYARLALWLAVFIALIVGSFVAFSAFADPCRLDAAAVELPRQSAS